MVHELTSPLAGHFVNRLRDQKLDALQFRQIVKQLSLLLADAAFGPADLRHETVETWQGKRELEVVDESDLLFVTVLRAGLPMLDAMMELFPAAQAGFLAMARNETTHEATLYYDRVPECRGKHLVLVDPMVATGGSLTDALKVLLPREPSRITSLNIIGAPEGIGRVMQAHSRLELYIAQIDERLDEDKYIVPGLGDAGDRAFNTL